MEKRSARITMGLLVGPFPPPVGGDTVMTARLIASRHWGERGVRLARVDVSAHGGVRLPDERFSWRDALRAARVFVQFVARLPRADFVLLWDNSRFLVTLGIPMVLVAAAARKPVFVKPFGAQIAQRIEELPAPWRLVVQRSLRAATSILPETRALARDLVGRLAFEKERVLWLPAFLPDSALLDSFPARGFSGRCVLVGQVKKEKGVFDIIDALRGRPGLRCDFYGPLLERDREAFLAEVASAPNVAYRGVLEPVSVGDAIRKYEVLLLPTFHTGEGYPAVVLEAYACGVPVVTTKWRSIPEIVDDGVTGLLIPPQAPHRIREALDRLSGDGSLYETLARGAFDRARSFSEQAVVAGILIPVVEKALARRGERRRRGNSGRGRGGTERGGASSGAPRARGSGSSAGARAPGAHGAEKDRP